MVQNKLIQWLPYFSKTVQSRSMMNTIMCTQAYFITRVLSTENSYTNTEIVFVLKHNL